MGYVHFGTDLDERKNNENFDVGLTVFGVDLVRISLRWKEYFTVTMLGFFVEFRLD